MSGLPDDEHEGSRNGEPSEYDIGCMLFALVVAGCVAVILIAALGSVLSERTWFIVP